MCVHVYEYVLHVTHPYPHSPRLFSHACQLTRWCGKMRHYNLEEADPSATREFARPRRELWTLQEFASSLHAHGEPCERVVVCMVHEDDVNPQDEPFYLARVVSKARKLDKDCLIGGNAYKAGHLVVNIKWYQYIDSSRGDRIYKLQSGSAKGIVYSVDSIVRNVEGIRFKSYSGGKYILGRETVTRLIRWLV